MADSYLDNSRAMSSFQRKGSYRKKGTSNMNSTTNSKAGFRRKYTKQETTITTSETESDTDSDVNPQTIDLRIGMQKRARDEMKKEVEMNELKEDFQQIERELLKKAKFKYG